MATNNIPKDIVQHIIDSGSDRVTIEDDSFLTALLVKGEHPLRLRIARFIGLSLVLIVTVAFVLSGAIFYVQNYLLDKVDLHINPFGAFERKSYNSEYAMFLYDPAEAWAASGIQVQKGDRLFIAGSGAYHTNYAKLIKATENNFWADAREQYVKNNLLDSFDIRRDSVFRFVDVTTPPEAVDPDHPKAIDLKNRKVKKPCNLEKTALFGDVLMQVIPETRLRTADTLSPERIYALPRLQIHKKEVLKIKHDGMLTFGVNDSTPANNVGQILVAMEIYRKQTWKNAAWKMASGQFIDLPYFWYNYWLHKGWYFWLASLLFVLWIMAEYVLLCVLCYCVPFLFIKDTWRPLTKRTKHMKKAHSLILLIALSGMMACTKQAEISPTIKAYQQAWHDNPFALQEEKDMLDAWIDKGDTASVLEAFGDTLKFGTAGLRELMGPGTNRMNRFTVALATQGFANYLKKIYPDTCISVVVGYDCRHNSQLFANVAADVFSANGIFVYLFDEMRPTPEISYALRALRCVAGVNITASHNRKEYNGYKAYWADGGQIVPPIDAAIVQEAAKLQEQDILHERNVNLVRIGGDSIDQAYIATIRSAILDAEAFEKASDLKIVYSPMHGAGYTIVPEGLKTYGIEQVSLVSNQLPDSGWFASVAHTNRHEANPEDEQAMKWLLRQAKREKADLAVATDPDADRFGFFCKDSRGRWHRIDGHQSTMLFTRYIIDTRNRLGMMPDKPYMGRTIVTSELVKKIAQDKGVRMYDEYTGFKWIAHRIDCVSHIDPDSTFIGAGEESFCYLPYDKARDKDAPASICLLAEMTAEAQMRGTTLWDDLMAIYAQYGFQREYTLKWKIDAANQRPWKENKEQIMQLFRTSIRSIQGDPILAFYDYSDRDTALLRGLPKADNVLQYFTQSGIKLTIRPSGTEPVLKVYMEIPSTRFDSPASYKLAANETRSVEVKIEKELQQILKDNKYKVL